MNNRRLIDLPTTRPELTSLRPTSPAVPEYVWQIINNYHANDTSTAWLHVRDFVLGVTLQMGPQTPDIGRRLMSMVGGYARWVWTVTGCDLTPGAVFTENLLQRYLAAMLVGRSETYRWDVQRQLATVARSLAGAEVATTRRPQTGRTARSYSQAQLATMLSWASTLPTVMKRRNAKAILGLCGGAGLTAAEVTAAHVEHIEVVGEHTVVHVQGVRARTVPVLDQWIRIVHGSVDGRTTGLLFKGYRFHEYPPRALQSFLTDNPSPVRASPARLHHGWVLTQMQRGLPLPVLIQLCGFASAANFDKYLPHLSASTPLSAEPFYPTVTARSAMVR